MADWEVAVMGVSSLGTVNPGSQPAVLEYAEAGTNAGEATVLMLNDGWSVLGQTTIIVDGTTDHFYTTFGRDRDLLSEPEPEPE